MELKDVFGAEPKSTWQVLCEPGTGFYVPAYQREYSWGKPNIDRLLEDGGHGLRKLVDHDDAITFIGTLIVIHDTTYQTVAPQEVGQLPGRVMLVIDGQQRLTTLLLLNTCLHEELSLRLWQLKDDERPAFKWLGNQTKFLINQLKKTFQEDMVHGDGVYQLYPRMIRAFIDSWSRDKTTARYSSPIAAYLHGYSDHVFQEATGRYNYQVPQNLGDDEAAKHKIITDNRKYLLRSIDDIAKCADEEMEFPKLEQIVNNDKFQLTLLKTKLPDEVRKMLDGSAQATPKERDRFNQLTRLLLFSKFMLERVAVTTVTAKNEDYAFDMFESLNTTGEPLTAFETFRPRVIDAESLGSYEHSPSRNSMKLIEGYLEQYTRAQAKQLATSRVLIPFALAETGEKLSKRLSDQRRFLKEEFERLGNIDEKRGFIRHLAHTAVFVKQIWPDAKADLPEVPEAQFPNKNLALLCLDVLRKANHHITIGVLTRFYSQLRSVSPGEVANASKEFEDAIKAVTGFFALWRGSRIGTENIDSVYRELMRTGFVDAGIEPLSRRPPDGTLPTPTADKLCAGLRHALAVKGGITSRDEWVKLAAHVPVYTSSVTLARFLFFAATHDTVPDPAYHGLVKAAKVGTLGMLSIEEWNQDLTVEHVAPQNPPATGWDKSLYDDEEIINRLGNLSLCPSIENASLGNRSWDVKRLMYRVLGSPTIDDLEPRLEEAKAAGINLAASTAKILELAKYLPHVRAIAEVETGWNAKLVADRSKRLAELAWDRIAPWLGL